VISVADSSYAKHPSGKGRNFNARRHPTSPFINDAQEFANRAEQLREERSRLNRAGARLFRRLARANSTTAVKREFAEVHRLASEPMKRRARGTARRVVVADALNAAALDNDDLAAMAMQFLMVRLCRVAGGSWTPKPGALRVELTLLIAVSVADAVRQVARLANQTGEPNGANDWSWMASVVSMDTVLRSDDDAHTLADHLTYLSEDPDSLPDVVLAPLSHLEREVLGLKWGLDVGHEPALLLSPDSTQRQAEDGQSIPQATNAAIARAMADAAEAGDHVITARQVQLAYERARAKVLENPDIREVFRDYLTERAAAGAKVGRASAGSRGVVR
jgi:hypothetical protein